MEENMPSTYKDVASLRGALQGRWKPVYQEMGGEMAPATDPTHAVELQGNEFKVIKGGKVAYEGRFNLTPQTFPHGIVLIYTTSIQPIFLGGPRPGVFQIEGDTLKWCFAGVGQAAPDGLNTYPGSVYVLTILQRDPQTPELASRRVLPEGGGNDLW